MNNTKKNVMKKKERRARLERSLRLITADRERTNILREGEQKTIARLVQKVPSWISSDGMTAIGFFGNLMVATSFVLALYFGRGWLLLALPGFVINWLGDSLDGRLAYYRQKPRKWYGFSLDVTVDWIGTVLIGTGYMIYAHSAWIFVGFAFVVLYGWEMITSQLRYKIGGSYSIDSGIFGPTEVRIIIATILIAEVIFPDAIHYLATLACFVLLLSNLKESRNLLRLADKRDKADRKKRKEKKKKKQKKSQDDTLDDGVRSDYGGTSQQEDHRGDTLPE